MSGTTSLRRFQAVEWAQAVLLAANLVWTTLCLGGYRAETMVVTSSLTAALFVLHAVGLALAAVTVRSVRKDGAITGGGALCPDEDAATTSQTSTAPQPGRSRLAAFNSQLSAPLHPAGWLFLPFLVYAAGNIAWISPMQWLGWFDWFGWLQLIGVFWVALNGVRSRGPQWLVLGTLFALAVVAVLLGSYQRFVRPDWLMLGRIQADQYAGRASGPFGIPNSLAAFFILLIPVSATLAVRRAAGAIQRVLFGWLTLVMLFGLVLTISRGAWIGFAIALTAWPMFAAQASWRRRLGFAGVALIGILVCGALAAAASPKVRERFAALVHDVGERSRPILWRAGWKIFRAHPLAGGGGGSFNVLFEPYRPEGFLNEPQWAHNDYLNTLSDYGALGFSLFFGAAAVTIVTCARSRPLDGGHDAGSPVREGRGAALGAAGPVRADRSAPVFRSSERRRRQDRSRLLDDPIVQQALAIGLLAFALQLFVDFHFKIPALAMAFAAIAGVLVQRRWRVGPSLNRSVAPLGGAAAVAVFVAAIILMWMVPQYRGEALRQHARGIIESLAEEPETSPHFAEALADARGELSRARTIAPANAQAWADAAYVEAQWSRRDKAAVVRLGQESEAYASRAISLAPLWAEFWIRRGVARDMQGRWLEAGDDFVRAITLSPNNTLTWYHHAYHLSLRKTEHDLAEAAVAFCLRLDPKNRDGLRLRHRLATGRLGP